MTYCLLLLFGRQKPLLVTFFHFFFGHFGREDSNLSDPLNDANAPGGEFHPTKVENCDSLKPKGAFPLYSCFAELINRMTPKFNGLIF